MSKFYLEEPSIKRKNEAISYIEEHLRYHSNINGSGGLDKGYIDYENWLIKNELKKYPETCPKDKCPAYTFFLIREDDNKIIGMINIRYNLNETMFRTGGHIGYGIRPTERGNGYNKINLYLGLLKCKELGLSKVLLTASDNNPASYRTILSLGGVLENKIKDDEEPNVLMGRYWIDVDASLLKYHDTFKDLIKEDSQSYGRK